MESEFKRIIDSMSLEEKVGQLFMENNESKYEVLLHVKQALKDGIIGSIIYFSVCNVENGLQLSELSIYINDEKIEGIHLPMKKIKANKAKEVNVLVEVK